MKRTIQIAACAIAMPGAVLAATRTYDMAAFEAVTVAAGVEVDITVGSTRSVVAETRSDNFDDLRMSVEGNVLRIDRTPRNWFSSWFSGGRPSYKVAVTTPSLRSVVASSGSEVSVKGNLTGDFSVTASSGSEVDLAGLNGGTVKATASSGSQIEIAGNCGSLEAEASSGSDLDAEDFTCSSAVVRASSGSDVSMAVTTRVTGSASSGSDVRVKGNPSVVQVDTSSGADVRVSGKKSASSGAGMDVEK